MTVEKFIEILKKCADPDLAHITFYVGETGYQLKSVGQFGLITDVNIDLEEIDIPMMSEVPISSFRRDKQEMMKETLTKIQNDLKFQVTSTASTYNVSGIISNEKPKHKIHKRVVKKKSAKKRKR